MSHRSSPNGTDKVFARVVHGPMWGKPIWVLCGTHLGHYGQHIKVIWSSMRENLSSEGCKHQRSRPACTSALSDQPLCCSIFVKYHRQTDYRYNIKFLVSLSDNNHYWAGGEG